MATTETARPQRIDARRNRELLVAAAASVLTEHGPDASLEEIARQAGVGIGTLYRHFPTRQDLLEAVFRDHIETLCEYAEGLRDDPDPYVALRDWLWAQVQSAARWQGVAASVMLTMLDKGDDQPPACEDLRAAGTSLLEKAQAAGAVRSDVDVDDLCRMGSAISIASEDADDNGEIAQRLFGLMMDGVRAPGTEPASSRPPTAKPTTKRA